MTRSMYWLCLLAIPLMLFGCWEVSLGDSDPDNTDQDPKLEKFDTSGCKGYEEDAPAAKLNDSDSALPNPEGNPIQAIAHDTSITIIHHNAYYQCGAEMSFKLTADGRDLKLNEIDNASMVTDCMCYMDLQTDITGLVPQTTYHVEVWDEFGDILFGEVDVTVGECDDTCVFDRDCRDLDLPHPECGGDWACMEGSCEWICDSDPIACSSDYDCPADYECVWYDQAQPSTPDENGADMPAMMCEVDSDCPEGQQCALVDCAEGYDCEPYGVCMGDDPWYGEGICEPRQVECYTDEDCYEYDWMPGPCLGGTYVACENNQCVFDCFDEECRSDYDCPNGSHCEFYDVYPDEPGYPEGGGETGIPLECASDADCPEGLWCELMDCGPNEDCYPYGMCVGGDPWPTEGVCVPDSQPECWEDADCPSGYHCEYSDIPVPGDDGTTDPTADEAPDMPPPYGICVADDPSFICWDLGGECFPLTADGAMCPPGWQLADMLYGVEPLCGVGGACCMPIEMECDSNADCAYGEVCVNGLCQGSCNCDDVYEPVCGYDGRTYPNACEAACDGVRILHHGACAEGCVCPEYFAPVCGTNGKTYDNECFAECDNVAILHQGFCDDPQYECSSDLDCPNGFICDPCPPYPGCPECDACGPAVCVPGNDPSCEDFGGFCIGLYPGSQCPDGYTVPQVTVVLCGDGGMCCAPITEDGELPD